MPAINKDVRNKFERFAILNNLSTVTFKSDMDGVRFVTGTIRLCQYRGYVIEQVVNECGGVKVLNKRRMSKPEIMAWFEGYEEGVQNLTLHLLK